MTPPARGILHRLPRNVHQCHPTPWQTRRLRAREGDEWTCAICQQVWVLHLRPAGMTDFIRVWEKHPNITMRRPTSKGANENE